MANINDTLRVFEHGGVLLIGSDTILNVQSGTLRFKPGLWGAKPYKDRGVLKQPLRGDERATELEFAVRWNGKITSAELYALLVTAGSSGLVKTFSIVAKFPDNAGAATGNQFTFASCYMPDDDKFEIQTGDEFDTMRVRFEDYETTPTAASY